MRNLVAHGLGGRTDLPISLGFAVGAAVVALVASFAALGARWTTARLSPVPSVALTKRTLRLPATVARTVQLVTLVLFLLVAAAGTFGGQDARANVAPVFLYVVVWVGVSMWCALVIDIWSVVNPFAALARLDDDDRAATSAAGAPARSVWPAAALLLAFVWLELVDPYRAEPRTVGVVVGTYTIVMTAIGAWQGRGWLRRNEAFTAWFGLLGLMSPLYRRPDGRLALRAPCTGLAAQRSAPGLQALVMVALGSTTFDGLTRTQWWLETTSALDQWAYALAATGALVGTIAAVWAAYLAAMTAVARLGDDQEGTGGAAARFVHSLVPIAFAYAVAHYVSLLLFEGQGFLAAASDPFVRGWDLFGTADRRIDFRWVSTDAIARVQILAVVLGHIAGVVLAHDRAIEAYGLAKAAVSQLPVLAVMVLLTFVALFLLLGG